MIGEVQALTLAIVIAVAIHWVNLPHTRHSTGSLRDSAHFGPQQPCVADTNNPCFTHGKLSSVMGAKGENVSSKKGWPAGTGEVRRGA